MLAINNKLHRSAPHSFNAVTLSMAIACQPVESIQRQFGFSVQAMELGQRAWPVQLEVTSIRRTPSGRFAKGYRFQCCVVMEIDSKKRIPTYFNILFPLRSKRRHVTLVCNWLQNCWNRSPIHCVCEPAGFLGLQFFFAFCAQGQPFEDDAEPVAQWSVVRLENVQFPVRTQMERCVL